MCTHWKGFFQYVKCVSSLSLCILCVELGIVICGFCSKPNYNMLYIVGHCLATEVL